ncbi:hypothetical protein MHM95_02060 [Pseudoalteromonas sp. CnMc7-15]|uniref:ATP-binding protein n=1 Tax=unclassified Pseudoalteromonas TaxID=194690 RepID=UPI001EF46840|nr:ATP-binding protein [Pseudoalteromonas sp. CnMc7-15]MCG7565081.1 hypothetical protein [Pseudoalteromonas sp. CnMc7-15]
MGVVQWGRFRTFDRVEFQGEERRRFSMEKKLCAYDKEPASQLFSTINEIERHLIKDGGIPVVIDLSNVQKITASGATALFSCVSRCQLETNKSFIIKMVPPRDGKADKLFRRSGLWDAVRPGTLRKLDKLWDTKNNFQSGDDPDRHLDPTLHILQENLDRQFPDKLKEAINEAYNNIVRHAYKKEVESRWWQYSYINREKNKLVFCIADRGIGIPNSFKNIKGGTATELISHAMIKGNTSTGKYYRGKGSWTMQKPVVKDIKDKLIVVSDIGVYKYVDQQEEPDVYQLAAPFNGTLLAWEFDLGGDS